jgi:hypothetical protein
MTANYHTVIGLYSNRAEAERAVQELVNEGFSKDTISVVAPGSAKDSPHLGPLNEVGSDPGPGGGAAVGGFAGFLAGMAALALPGIGPVLAVGPFAAGLMGAGIGAAAGGIAGALKGHGVPEEHATRYSEAVGKGDCLVMVHSDSGRVVQAVDILDRNRAVSVDEDSAETRATTPEALEAARTKPGESLRDRQRQQERRASVYPGITGGGPTASS